MNLRNAFRNIYMTQKQRSLTMSYKIVIFILQKRLPLVVVVHIRDSELINNESID
jgi:hypothetical protein